MAVDSGQIQTLGSFAWSIAEILRGDFKQSEYGKVILPFVVLRRLDCILEKSKPAVLKAAESLPKGVDEATRDMILFGAAGQDIKVYNLSRFTFASLKGQDARQLHDNLVDYITKFSGNVRDIFLDKFLFTDQLKRLKELETENARLKRVIADLALDKLILSEAARGNLLARCAAQSVESE